MKVVIFGGTGFIGRNLINELLLYGYPVSVITRNSVKYIANAENKVQMIRWQNDSPLSSISELKDVDVIINLAGESTGNHRWTDAVKREILNSRIRTTKAIVTAINNQAILPKVLINASAVGYYGPRKDEEITEIEEAGQDFLAQVCRDWENEAYSVQSDLTRVIALRIGVVLGTEGALNRMVMPFRFYIGGPLGKGNQWLSWIHINDLTSLICFIIDHPELTGPINASAPEPVKMRDFCKALGKVLNRPSWLPVPETLLRFALGQMAEMLIHGQRAVPKKAMDAGYKFQFHNLESALIDILKKTDNVQPTL